MSLFRTDAEVAVQVLHENGGFLLTSDPQLVQGQIASLGYEEQMPLEQFNADSILTFRRKNFHLIKDGAMIGGWANEGLVFLDLVGEGQPGADDPQKITTMIHHPIYAPEILEDDEHNIEGEEDPNLHGWQGILPQDQALPYPAATTSSLPRMASDFDWSIPDDDSGEEGVYKWVWNEKEGMLMWMASPDEGLPTHAQTIMHYWHRDQIVGQDWLGYAVPSDGGFELESYKDACPIQAFQAAKEQLAKIEPHSHVIIPDYANGADAIGADLHLAPPHKARHQAASQWANAAFGDGTPPLIAVPKVHRLGGFSALGTLYKEAEADKSGCMIALYVPADVAEEIAVKGGEPANDLHITLAYFEDKAVDRDDWDKAIKIARSVAAEHDPMKGKISGCGVFHMDDGDVLWAAPSIPGLAEFRTELVESLNRAGFRVSDEYGYQPHITLKYEFKGKPPRSDGNKMQFDAAYFVKAENRTELPFG